MNTDELLQAEYKAINEMWKLLKKWVTKAPLQGDDWGIFADEVSAFAHSRGENNKYMYSLGNAIIGEIESISVKGVE